MANCQNEALELARKHGKLELYGEILLDTLAPDELKTEDFTNLAAHFEERGNNLLAGKYWFHAREYQKVGLTLIFSFSISIQRFDCITS